MKRGVVRVDVYRPNVVGPLASDGCAARTSERTEFVVLKDCQLNSSRLLSPRENSLLTPVSMLKIPSPMTLLRISSDCR